MTEFENYLIGQGYKKHVKQFINGHWVYLRTDKHTISTLENIDHHYLKGDNPVIVFGLNEKGKPSTLISPRPFIRREKAEGYLRESVVRDDEMNRILSKHSPETILNCILSGKTLINFGE